MMNENAHQTLLNRAIEIMNTEHSVKGMMSRICELLHREVPHYNWVGFYLADNENRVLVLGPYSGAATDHKRIPYGTGICGQVAVNHNTMNIEDVNAEDNYLACSIETKSELVVPIMREGVFLGQLDIDSHKINAFNIRDERLLQSICRRLAEYIS